MDRGEGEYKYFYTMKKQDMSIYTHVLHFIYAFEIARGNKILFSK